MAEPNITVKFDTPTVANADLSAEKQLEALAIQGATIMMAAFMQTAKQHGTYAAKDLPAMATEFKKALMK